MKKILYPIALGLLFFGASCSSDSDSIVDVVSEVTVTLPLSNLISSYDFYDTKHNINIQDKLRVFYSEDEQFILSRTMFYDSNENLVDSIVNFYTDTNLKQSNINLPAGRYTVITTLNFALDNDIKLSWWNLCNKEKLSTAMIKPKASQIKYAIMSYDYKEITVESGKSLTLNMDPQPVGALCYMYLQDFQYKNEASYGTEADNGVRSIGLLTQKKADGFRLSPYVRDRYNSLGDAGSSTYYYLSSKLEPSDFSGSADYGYFRTDLIAFCYILAPSFNLCFGYTTETSTGFYSYGEADYTIQDGRTYLAYWDWFKVGDPYFGIANNNHWNSYTKSTRGDFEEYFDFSKGYKDYSVVENLQ